MTRARLASAPLLVVGFAFVLWWVSDRLLYIGPLDRATFGWVVVFPLWAVAPTFAGFSWRGSSAGARTQFAGIGGLAVGSIAALLLWLSVAGPAVGCTPRYTPVELVPPALAVGGVIGGGFFLACRLASAEVSAGHIGRGATYGAVIQLLIIPVASMLFFIAFFGLCQRP